MKAILLQYMHLLIFFVPLGVVGIWRWIIWLIKKITAMFYQVPAGKPLEGTFAVVTPVYNEDPKIFKLALQSWIEKGDVDEIVAVIDYSDKKSINIYKKFVAKDIKFKLIITKTPGKRQALADGVKFAECEFVALVDSDTIWTTPIRSQVLHAFSDEKVGGVATRQDVFEPNTLAKKLFQIHLNSRYFNEMAFLAVVDDALTCISGRTAVYRRSAILPELDELVSERFLGKQVISGDDKTLTRLVQSRGWKVKYFMNAVVLTPGFEKILPLLKQLVRWNRNSWRSDLQSLGSKWLWKSHKILGVYMLDRFVQPFTLLLGAIYFFVALRLGYWQIPLGLFAWWMISRSIKIFSHLIRHPRDILIMPVYVIFTYVTAVIKIYSLVTLNTQGWITRWSSKRLQKNIFPQIGAIALTLVIFGIYFGGIAWYQNFAVKTRMARQAFGNNSIVFSGSRSFDDNKLMEIKNELVKKHADTKLAFYALKRKDTLTAVQRKFNLSELSVISTEGVNKNLLPVGEQITMPVDEMRTPLKAEEIREKKAQGVLPPLVLYDAQANRIQVKGAGSIVTLVDIQKRLGKNSNLLMNDGKEWILRANLYISKGVTLLIDGQDVSYLKLKSDPNSFIWLRGEGSNILISNTKITSWDEQNKQPDGNQSDGRSFIVAKGSGRMDVLNSEIAYLGMEGYGKRGGAFGGSYGLSWKIASKSFKSNLLTGVVSQNNIHNNYFGIYTFGTTGMVISDNNVYDNDVYGIDPHDDSNNITIARNNVYRNKKHGIIISKRCNNNEIIDNISRDNGYHGIMIHADSNNNLVKGNTVYGNHDGIAVYASMSNILDGNNVNNNKQGLRISHGSENNYVENNSFVNNLTGMHVYSQSKENILVNNSVKDNRVGLSLHDAVNNKFYNNFKKLENLKDGNVRTTAVGNEITY